jgi:hypothetical protein
LVIGGSWVSHFDDESGGSEYRLSLHAPRAIRHEKAGCGRQALASPAHPLPAAVFLRLRTGTIAYLDPFCPAAMTPKDRSRFLSKLDETVNAVCRGGRPPMRALPPAADGPSP